MPIPPPWPDTFSFSFFAEPGRSVASYFPAAGTRDERKEDKPASVKSGGKEVEPEDDWFAARLQKQQAKRKREDDMPKDERNSVRRRRSSRSRSPRRGRLGDGDPISPRAPATPAKAFSSTSSRAMWVPPPHDTPPPAASRSFSPTPSSRPRPPPRPGVLVEEHFRPSLRSLTLESYAPYLLDEPIELAWSSPYYNLLHRFIEACAPPQLWRTHRDKQTIVETFAIVAHLRATQPAKEAIRAAVGPLGKVPYAGVPTQLYFRLRAMRDVMRWIWNRNIALEQTAWLVAESSRNPRLLPIHILIREYASTLRFSDAIEAGQQELLAYLSSRPHSALPAREYRALLLLQWLNTAPQRWYRFFATPDRRIRAGVRGEEPWAWWLDGAAVEWKVEVLDDWEKGVLERERWEE
ncbi:hypothetical protein JCM10213_008422 [Rhodosporidiobolus nylandii]